jgi:TonB-linked SusC/RagA family outer membrane protein
VSRGVYSNRFFLDLLNENTLNYKKVLKNHTIGLLAGFTAQKTNINSDQAIGLNFADDNISTLNTALTKDQLGTFNTKNQIGLLSYLGRVTYGYQNKYLFSASYRADGSSYFAPGKKWGKFPSLSVGWIASEEKLLKDISWLSQLKFRGSYGVTGNNRIVDFAFVDLLYASNYPLGPGTGTVTTGQVPSRDILSNANITWEQTFQFNGGLDLSILENTVTLGFDIYRSKTDRLLLRQAIMGFAGVPQTWNNIGSLQNDGVELEISSNNVVTENFTWTTSANISRTRNKILELGTEAFLFNQGERTEIYRNKVGDPLVQFFGFKTDGVWLSQAQITESGIKSSLSNALVPGGLKLVDLDGNGILNADDRTVIGSPYPDFTWGVSNNFKYKAFDLSFMFQGVEGGSLINGDPNYLEIRRTVKAYSTNRWLSPAFPGDGQTPYSSNGFSWLLTDYVVEDASYVALREILVGYSLPNKLTKRAGIKGLRIYLTGQNLFFKTAKGYRGLNPEARFQTGPYNTPLIDGYQRGSFPVSRTFLFGLDLNF